MSDLSKAYRYCDRWCSKCSLTDVCSRYNAVTQTESFISLLENTKSRSDKDFEELSQNFVQDGLENKHTLSYFEIREIAYINNVSELARKCDQLLSEFLENHREEFVMMENNARSIAALGGDVHASESGEIYELIERMARYRSILPEKVLMAYFIVMASDIDSSKIKTVPNGLVKLVLVCIDFLLNDCIEIMSKINESKDELQEIVRNIDKLYVELCRDFPEASLFERPGLDSPTH